MDLIIQPGSRGAAADLDRAITLLHEVRDGHRGSTLRLYRPQPTMAFGQRDTHLPGFDAARQAARDHGFEPLVRKAGGRAMPYHQGCLVVDQLEPENDAMLGARERFRQFGALFASMLQTLGVDAAVGEIPGEYCPGEFSVHGTFPESQLRGQRRRIKLVGTAQRVVSGAWLFSSAIVVEDPEPLRDVLVDTYAALDLPLDPGTVGCAADLQRKISMDAVRQTILQVYRDRR